jgi:dihydrofolate reductase
MVKIILTCTKNGGISYNNIIPWHNIPDIFKLLKIITNNSNIIMGYNTWLYFLNNKPFINNKNIILTKNNKNIIKNIQNIKIYDNIHKTITKYNDHNTFYIGGSIIFNYLIDNNLITEAHINFIDTDYICDKFININKLRNSNYIIQSKQHFKDFTYLHIVLINSSNVL